MDIYSGARENKAKQFAILVDPEQCDKKTLGVVISLASSCSVDYILVGGSLLVKDHLDECIQLIKSETGLPVILFPGSEMQVNGKADAILLLSSIKISPQISFLNCSILGSTLIIYSLILQQKY